MLALALVLTLCLGGCRKNPKENHIFETDTQLPQSETTPRYEKTEETVNAYDYIIETMAAPQYWSESQWDLGWEEEAPFAEDKGRRETYFKNLKADRTGWTLIDEDSATFQRGCDYILRICFRDHTALWVDLSGDGYFLDFKNDDFFTFKTSRQTYQRIFEKEYFDGISGCEDYPGHEGADSPMKFSETVDRTAIEWKKNGDGEVLFFGVYHSLGYVEKIFPYYEEIFRAAGCPLLCRDNGTLTGYKKTKVQKVETSDGLVHAVWEQEGWCHDYTKEDEKVQWIQDIKEIFSKRHPEKIEGITGEEIECTDGNGKVRTLTRYSQAPLFLVTTTRSKAYESRTSYDNVSGYAEELAIYYLKPMMERIYGYDAVYFLNGDSLPMHEDTKISGNYPLEVARTREDIEKGGYVQNAWGKIYRIHFYGDYVIDCFDLPKGADELEKKAVNYLMFTYNTDGVRDKFEKICPERIAKGEDFHTGVFFEEGGARTVFAEDWFENFELTYDYSARCRLGLY